MSSVLDPGPVVLNESAIPAIGFRFEEHARRSIPGDPVAGTWRSHVSTGADHRLRVVPDGCVEISRSSEGETLVYGPTATWSDLSLGAGRGYAGIRLAPGAALALLRVDVDELTGLVVDAGDIAALRPVARLVTPGWTERALAVFEDRRTSFADDAVAVAAPGLLTGFDRPPVPEVARTLGMSDRQFRRRFVRAVGLAPSTFRRIARARTAHAAIVNRPERSLAVLAYDLGFADQAHLGREVHDVTGSTPGQLRDAARLRPSRLVG